MEFFILVVAVDGIVKVQNARQFAVRGTKVDLAFVPEADPKDVDGGHGIEEDEACRQRGAPVVVRVRTAVVHPELETWRLRRGRGVGQLARSQKESMFGLQAVHPEFEIHAGLCRGVDAQVQSQGPEVPCIFTGSDRGRSRVCARGGQELSNQSLAEVKAQPEHMLSFGAGKKLHLRAAEEEEDHAKRDRTAGREGDATSRSHSDDGGLGDVIVNFDDNVVPGVDEDVLGPGPKAHTDTGLLVQSLDAEWVLEWLSGRRSCQVTDDRAGAPALDVVVHEGSPLGIWSSVRWNGPRAWHAGLATLRC